MQEHVESTVHDNGDGGERHPLNFCKNIRQDNDIVCAENYCMKIIMDIISYFICTIFWKIFVYCGFNTVVY